MAAIETVDLSRSFTGHNALQSLTLEVEPGEVLALLGPNGAGKTTTVRLLNGVLSADSGYCKVLGIDPADDGNAVRSLTGVLTESAGLDDRLTARENLESAARLRGMDRREARRKVSEQLEQFAMYDLADRRTGGFSTGQRKRLALARALVHDPEVLFLDEPTSGLDPTATREVTDLIGYLARDRGRTIILCTHFLGEAGRIADRMAVLDHGVLRAIGEPAQLAADLWTGHPAYLEFDGPADPVLVARLAAQSGVTDVEATPEGCTLRVADRALMGTLISELTTAGIVVYGGGVRPVSIEDVYFEIERRFTTAADPQPPAPYVLEMQAV